MTRVTEAPAARDHDSAVDANHSGHVLVCDAPASPESAGYLPLLTLDSAAANTLRQSFTESGLGFQFTVSSTVDCSDAVAAQSSAGSVPAAVIRADCWNCASASRDEMPTP